MPPKTFKIDLVPVTTKDGKQEYAMVQKNQELVPSMPRVPVDSRSVTGNRWWVGVGFNAGRD